MSRVFFHVQHLLGIGHIRRAAVLARTLAASGFDVLLVSGGAPLKLDLGRARFHQLPPVRARDEGLRELSRLDGAPLDEAFKSGRVRALLELFGAEQPDVLITEQFPFGRTQDFMCRCRMKKRPKKFSKNFARCSNRSRLRRLATI